MRAIVVSAAMLGVLGGCAPDDFSYTRGPDDHGCHDDSCAAVPDAGSCEAPWRAPIEDVRLRALSADASALWVAGELERDGRDPVAWVGRLAACQGELELSAPISVVPSTLGAIALAEPGVFAAGASEGDAWLIELAADTLETKSASSQAGASFDAIARSGAVLWAAGATGDPARAFALQLSPPSSPCTLELAAAPSGVAALATGTSGVFAAGSAGAAAAVFLLDPAGCGAPPQAFTGLLPPGATSAEARAIAIVNGEVQIGGSAETAAGRVGFVLAVGDNGAAGASVIVDAGAESALVAALATDGSRLFVGGSQASSATLAAYPLPLGSAQPSFAHVFSDAEVVSALAFEPATSSVYATLSRADGRSSIVRCTADGSCP